MFYKKSAIIKLTKERSFMKQILFLIALAIIFTACEEKSIAEQRLECKQQGKKFKTQKVFNYRHGEYTLKGECI